MNLFSEDVRKQLDYYATMEYIEMLQQLNEKDSNNLTGSERYGLKIANFYYEKINKMLESEQVDTVILKELQELVHKDLKAVRYDCEERVQNSICPSYTFEQTRKTNIMMSMIMDFIATLPSATP